ncbi:hypothetical protein NORO109296_20645 [Nocardiopsis rhodophaea]
MPFAQFGGERVGDVVDLVEQGAQAPLDVHGGDVLGRRVDGDDLVGELSDALLLAAVVGQHLVLGVCELGGAPVVADPPGEQSAGADPQVLHVVPGLLEEDQGEPVGAVGDDDLQALGLTPGGALAELAAAHAVHVGHHGDLLALGQGAKRGELAPGGVPARVVAQQVAHGVQIEVGGELLGRAGPQRLAQRLVPSDHWSPPTGRLFPHGRAHGDRVPTPTSCTTLERVYNEQSAQCDSARRWRRGTRAGLYSIQHSHLRRRLTGRSDGGCGAGLRSRLGAYAGHSAGAFLPFGGERRRSCTLPRLARPR